MGKRTKTMVMAALMAAITCVATMIIKIPSPLKGYLNLGDCIVLAAAWLLPPAYSFVAAGLGSALADLFSGYVIYAPATFIVKGLMALVAYYIAKLMKKWLGKLPSRLSAGVAAELVMVLGYYLFEGVLYGFGPSLVNVPANGVQGVAGVIIGLLLIQFLEKSKITLK